MVDVSEDIRRELRLPKVGQIGYVVSDAQGTAEFCRDAFGMRPWLLTEERPDPCAERGRAVHPCLRFALTYVGGVQVELIQVIEGETFHRDHAAKPESEVHHLGFMVRDLERRLAQYRDMGIDIIQRGTIWETGIKIGYAYLDTVDRAGIVIEVMRWGLGPLPMPVNQSTFGLVCRLGARTIFRGRVIR